MLEKKIQVLGISLSIGVAQTGPNHFVNGKELIKQADESMYAFKKAHKATKKNPVKSASETVIDEKSQR